MRDISEVIEMLKMTFQKILFASSLFILSAYITSSDASIEVGESKYDSFHIKSTPNSWMKWVEIPIL